LALLVDQARAVAHSAGKIPQQARAQHGVVLAERQQAIA
jgi:hypothetical protein